MLMLFIASSAVRALFWLVVAMLGACAVCAALPLIVIVLLVLVCLERVTLGKPRT